MTAEVDLEAVRRRLRGRAPSQVDEAPRRAAVAAILRQPGDAGDAEVLLIRRAEHPDDPWSGHMAFPGGRRDPEDPSLLHTAQRETREEVGLDLDRQGELVGQLDDMPAIARGRPVGLVITPFVFAVHEVPPLVTDASEVAEALWVPLGPLVRGEAHTTRPYDHEGQRFLLPAFDVDGRVVWGLTYEMLQSFFRLLRQGG
jgi:8-oxo-dGTP pyrophosphatase MutT (NUDIX family)